MSQPIKVDFFIVPIKLRSFCWSGCYDVLLVETAFKKNVGCLPPLNYEVLIHFQNNEVVYHFQKLRSSSIFENKIKVVFHFPKNGGFIKVEVLFHISSSWVKTVLYTKNKLPRLPRAKLMYIY
jgi:hypothetical protein